MRLVPVLAFALLLGSWPLHARAGASVQLEDLSWTELRDRIHAGATTLLIPIGGTEQSGPALTLGKHNARVRVLAQRIAEGLGNTLVAPVLAYVPEGGIAPPSSHMRFPGTLTVPDAVFEAVLASTADSARIHGFRRIVLLGDHGGYQDDLHQVAARLNQAWAGQDARVLVPAEYYRSSSEGFAALLRQRGFRDDEIGTHAGLADTSLQLAVAPQTVRQDALRSMSRPGPADGIYGGDPRRASAELGQLGVDAIIRQTIDALRRDKAVH